MSNTNSPGGTGDSGASWPEYLGGAGAGGSSEPQPEGPRHRVIGTPPPAAARTLLPEPGSGGRQPTQPFLPPEPDNPRRARKAELIVAACFILAMLAGFAFLVAYALIGVGPINEVLHSNLALGGTLSLVFLLLGAGAVIWVRHLMPTVEITEQRHPMRATDEQRAEFKKTWEEGAAASQFVKRPLVRRTLIAATVPLAVAPLFLLRDLGPLPGTSLDTTVWRKGLRLLVYGTGRPITAAEFNSPGSLITVGPEGFLADDDAMAKAAVIIIKFRPGQLVFGPPVRPGHPSPPNLTVPNWTVANIVAYSKICTHVGCPAALYEQTTHHILCPCHQSTFDATRGAKVIFGPATRALPQLPIGVDSEGFLIATGSFNEPVGPEFLGAVMSVERALEGTGNWLDDRLHGARGIRVLLRKIFPDHWTFLLGEINLYTFIILLLTGTFLTLWFQPSMTDVVYHGSYVPLRGVRMSEAYASTLHISFDVRGGLLMRQIHHWAADLFLAGIFAHMIRIFFTGAYRKPREINWLIGIVILTLGMFEGLFGYSLPDDLLSGAGLRITEGVLQSFPLVGTYLAYFLFGGPFPGNQVIGRLYIIHVLLIPALLLALITVHLFLTFYQKHTQMPGKGRTNENVVGAPLYPYFLAKTGAFFFFTFAAVTLAATFTQINAVWLYGPFNPVAISSGSQPDFYMGILEGALRIMPNWQWVVFGHTFAFNVFLPALVPLGIVFTGAALWPFLEQWVTGDRREHHLVDRPRNAPTRTAIGIATITFYGVLWAEGANDVLADHLDVPLYWTTWFARIGIFVGPAIAYYITKRICLGLQRKDNHLLEHGVETGIIRQLPGGEFIEETRPVDEDQLAVLTSRPIHPALPAGETAETEVPAPGMRGGLGRVRERLYKVITESAPLPEHVHGNGHGNGHGDGQLAAGEHNGHGEQQTGAASSGGEPQHGEDSH